MVMFGTEYECNWAHNLLLFLRVSNILFCLQNGREQDGLWVKQETVLMQKIKSYLLQTRCTTPKNINQSFQNFKKLLYIQHSHIVLVGFEHETKNTNVIIQST